MIDNELWHGHIVIENLSGKDIEDNPKATIGTLSETANEWIVDILMKKWTEEGGAPCTKSEADQIWGPQAKAHAQRWIERQAPAWDWYEIIRIIREMAPHPNHITVMMNRLVQIVTKGPELVTKLRLCEPWVAREACFNVSEDVLNEDIRTWPIRAVQNWQDKDKKSKRATMTRNAGSNTGAGQQ